MTIDKQALRQLATDAHELGIIKRYTKGIEANKRFIAAANPATVLALLDELEHYKSREDRVTKLVQDNSTSWDELYKKLEAAEKRIAELQIARDKCFLSGLKTGWEYGIADDTEGYNREIADAQAVIDRAAGIGVKGD
ncbi:ead/Ea22-like family protein [Salmonella enterica subsp. enterica serovar Muenchen]|uniref:Ead/Ea22-like family protein n=1 Tax=Salmonella enterica subsp. enterica serovar Ank TaxID=1173578 RepID=A0A727BZ37_SALET|nr:ead/Ea22-like family protein [Salmonella enterica subsp. enterica serovar Muenchen]EBV7249315.1 ead/Ea22-like family protein [Salmonella enterica subsp. enterica serovar Pomona]EEJ1799854.1 ead/Ea22-like family protein [Salmonella enterica subsp. enterica serovar Pomona]HAE1794697.1 ead/Ea22-like family protein [Salmonella enterica subsp. enterica serovar Ank]